jgi:hypothetical protein
MRVTAFAVRELAAEERVIVQLYTILLRIPPLDVEN